ncbi:hypothetical protein L209DRAFT_267374, partial [Thermothelomyces heterothallicus CBS 203.75]
MVHQIVIKLLHLRCIIISARSILCRAPSVLDKRHLGGEVRFGSRAVIHIIVTVSKEAAPEMGVLDGSLTVEPPNSSCRRIGAVIYLQANMGQGRRMKALLSS